MAGKDVLPAHEAALEAPDMSGSGRRDTAALGMSVSGYPSAMTLFDRLRLWFARRRGDPVLSSPSQEAQLELTSREQEDKLLNEGKTPRD